MPDEIRRDHPLAAYRSVLKDDDALPLYYQVLFVLKHVIDEGEISPGDSFFSEQEIAMYLGISRPTVNKAMKALLDEDYIERHRGKRAVVKGRHDVPLIFMEQLVSFGEMLDQLGIEHRTALLNKEIRPAPQNAISALRLAPGDKALWLRRLRFLADEPLLVVDSFLPYPMFAAIAELPDEAFEEDLYHLIEMHCGVRVVGAHREVHAISISLQDSELLHVQTWEPCLRLIGSSYASGDVPVEHFDSRLRGDRCVLSSKLERDSSHT